MKVLVLSVFVVYICARVIGEPTRALHHKVNIERVYNSDRANNHARHENGALSKSEMADKQDGGWEFQEMTRPQHKDHFAVEFDNIYDYGKENYDQDENFEDSYRRNSEEIEEVVSEILRNVIGLKGHRESNELLHALTGERNEIGAINYIGNLIGTNDRTKIHAFIRRCRGSRSWKFVIDFLMSMEGKSELSVVVALLKELTNEKDVFKAFNILRPLTGHADFDAIFEILQKISGERHPHGVCDYFRHVAHTTGVDGVRLEVLKLTGGRGPSEFPKVLKVFVHEVDLRGAVNMLMSATRTGDIGEAILEFTKIMNVNTFAEAVIVMRKVTKQSQLKYALEELLHSVYRRSLKTTAEDLFKICGCDDFEDARRILGETFHSDNLVSVAIKINRVTKRQDPLFFLSSILDVTQTSNIIEANEAIRTLTTRRTSTLNILEQIRINSRHENIIELFRRLISSTGTRSIQEAWEEITTVTYIEDIFLFFTMVDKSTEMDSVTLLETILRITNSPTVTIAAGLLEKVCGRSGLFEVIEEISNITKMDIVKFFELVITLSNRFYFEEAVLLLEEYTDTKNFIAALADLRRATGQPDIPQAIEYIKQNKPRVEKSTTSTEIPEETTHYEPEYVIQYESTEGVTERPKYTGNTEGVDISVTTEEFVIPENSGSTEKYNTERSSTVESATKQFEEPEYSGSTEQPNSEYRDTSTATENERSGTSQSTTEPFERPENSGITEKYSTEQPTSKSHNTSTTENYQPENPGITDTEPTTNKNIDQENENKPNIDKTEIDNSSINPAEDIKDYKVEITEELTPTVIIEESTNPTPSYTDLPTVIIDLPDNTKTDRQENTYDTVFDSVDIHRQNIESSANNDKQTDHTDNVFAGVTDIHRENIESSAFNRETVERDIKSDKIDFTDKHDEENTEVTSTSDRNEFTERTVGEITAINPVGITSEDETEFVNYQNEPQTDAIDKYIEIGTENLVTELDKTEPVNYETEKPQSEAINNPSNIQFETSTVNQLSEATTDKSEVNYKDYSITSNYEDLFEVPDLEISTNSPDITEKSSTIDNTYLDNNSELTQGLDKVDLETGTPYTPVYKNIGSETPKIQDATTEKIPENVGLTTENITEKIDINTENIPVNTDVTEEMRNAEITEETVSYNEEIEGRQETAMDETTNYSTKDISTDANLNKDITTELIDNQDSFTDGSTNKKSENDTIKEITGDAVTSAYEKDLTTDKEFTNNEGTSTEHFTDDFSATDRYSIDSSDTISDEGITKITSITEGTTEAAYPEEMTSDDSSSDLTTIVEKSASETSMEDTYNDLTTIIEKSEAETFTSNNYLTEDTSENKQGLSTEEYLTSTPGNAIYTTPTFESIKDAETKGNTGIDNYSTTDNIHTEDIISTTDKTKANDEISTIEAATSAIKDSIDEDFTVINEDIEPIDTTPIINYKDAPSPTEYTLTTEISQNEDSEGKSEHNEEEIINIASTADTDLTKEFEPNDINTGIIFTTPASTLSSNEEFKTDRYLVQDTILETAVENEETTSNQESIDEIKNESNENSPDFDSITEESLNTKASTVEDIDEEIITTAVTNSESVNETTQAIDENDMNMEESTDKTTSDLTEPTSLTTEQFSSSIQEPVTELSTEYTELTTKDAIGENISINTEGIDKDSRTEQLSTKDIETTTKDSMAKDILPKLPSLEAEPTTINSIPQETPMVTEEFNLSKEIDEEELSTKEIETTTRDLTQESSLATEQVNLSKEIDEASMTEEIPSLKTVSTGELMVDGTSLTEISNYKHITAETKEEIEPTTVDSIKDAFLTTAEDITTDNSNKFTTDEGITYTDEIDTTDYDISRIDDTTPSEIASTDVTNDHSSNNFASNTYNYPTSPKSAKEFTTERSNEDITEPANTNELEQVREITNINEFEDVRTHSALEDTSTSDGTSATTKYETEITTEDLDDISSTNEASITERYDTTTQDLEDTISYITKDTTESYDTIRELSTERQVIEDSTEDLVDDNSSATDNDIPSVATDSGEKTSILENPSTKKFDSDVNESSEIISSASASKSDEDTQLIKELEFSPESTTNEAETDFEEPSDTTLTESYATTQKISDSLTQYTDRTESSIEAYDTEQESISTVQPQSDNELPIPEINETTENIGNDEEYKTGVDSTTYVPDDILIDKPIVDINESTIKESKTEENSSLGEGVTNEFITVSNLGVKTESQDTESNLEIEQQTTRQAYSNTPENYFNVEENTKQYLDESHTENLEEINKSEFMDEHDTLKSTSSDTIDKIKEPIIEIITDLDINSDPSITDSIDKSENQAKYMPVTETTIDESHELENQATSTITEFTDIPNESTSIVAETENYTHANKINDLTDNETFNTFDATNIAEESHPTSENIPKETEKPEIETTKDIVEKVTDSSQDFTEIGGKSVLNEESDNSPSFEGITLVKPGEKRRPKVISKETPPTPPGEHIFNEKDRTPYYSSGGKLALNQGKKEILQALETNMNLKILILPNGPQGNNCFCTCDSNSPPKLVPYDELPEEITAA